MPLRRRASRAGLAALVVAGAFAAAASSVVSSSVGSPAAAAPTAATKTAATKTAATKTAATKTAKAPVVPPAVPTTACQQAPNPGAVVPPLAPRDPLITTLGLDQAWALSTGVGVTVAVVDTGVDPSSPKLRGAVDVGVSLHTVQTPAVFATSPDGRTDCDGHGTEIAGIIAGRTAAGDDRVSGVAPSARIYPVSIQGTIAQAPATLIAAAIRVAADHARVLNLSFAQTTDNAEIRAAVRYAVDTRNDVVVAASSNEGAQQANGSSPKWYPAAYPGVLAVASVAADGSPDAQAATGSWISIAAPGDSLTTVPRGGKNYVTVTGTSFATAIVSGAAALVRARDPGLPAAEVIARLEHTAVPPGDGSHDDAIGYGIVDPFAALTLTTPPGASASAARGGAVPVQKIAAPRRNPSSAGVLGATAVLIALAIIVGLATISVRSGRRRGWHAGRRLRTQVEERTAQAHPAELG